MQEIHGCAQSSVRLGAKRGLSASLGVRQFVAGAMLVGTACNANAVMVSVTADFTRFTMGQFWSGANTVSNGLTVNGAVIDVCGSDPTCAIAETNPGSVSVALSGSSVDFGYANTPWLPSNQFSFTGYSSDVSGTGPLNDFALGSFSFTNGAFFPLAFVDFTLTTHSTDALYDNHVYSGSIRLDTVSSSTIDPLAEADYFTLLDSSGSPRNDLGSVRVYDYNRCPVGDPAAPSCNTGGVDIFGFINSLHLSSFENPTGGAFLNTSMGPVLDPTNPTQVSEPSTLLLFGGGIGLLGLSARRGTTRRSRPVVERISESLP